jgi:hypothetical protein
MSVLPVICSHPRLWSQTNAFKARCGDLEHSVATGLSGFPRAAHCLSLLCALTNLIGLAALVHETH